DRRYPFERSDLLPLLAVFADYRRIPRVGTARWKLYGSSRAPGRPVGSCTAHPVLRDGPLEAVRLIPRFGTARWKLYGSSRASGRRVGSGEADAVARDAPAEAVGPITYAGDGPG